MQLTDLSIHGFRAFPPEEQSIDFEGENAVIVGDNGTGKSSILAAVEFLLTGGMSHLSGPGTGDITIQSHAPHQWAQPDDCYVRGEFVNQAGERAVVERCAANSTNLELIEGDVDPSEIEISQWNNDHLILTRGQLLEFIESAPANRGEQLSKLLNLSGITNRAHGFNRIRGYLESKEQTKRSICERQVGDIGSALNLDPNFPIDDSENEEILNRVNSKLVELGSHTIDSTSELPEAIDSIDIVVREDEIDPLYESRTIDRLSGVLEWNRENRQEYEEKLSGFAEALGELDTYEALSLYQDDFFEAANEIVDESTRICPLCEEEHEEGYLHHRVQEERDRLSTIRDLRSSLNEKRSSLLNLIRSHASQVEEVLERIDRGIEAGSHDEISEDVEEIRSYITEIERIEEELDQDYIYETDEGSIEIRQIDTSELSPDWDLVETPANQVNSYMEELEPREEQSAIYGDLISVMNAWNTIEEEAITLGEIERMVDELEEVQDQFSLARETVLEFLYLSIEDKFNEYYSTIHPDEQEIDLDFNASGTDSVDLVATFEEERDHPLAYHSEGHIDTMGVCLFLALRDQLNTSGPDIVMLDDIVMSVDKTHRQGVGQMLRECLDDSTQGILATHDEVWADQLTKTNVVPRSNVSEISDWDISTGPMLHGGAWDIVDEYIGNNRKHAAAAHLRRQAEKLSRIAAARLRARMDYKERYELADFVFGITRRIRDVTKSASDHYDDRSEEWERAQSFEERRTDLLGDVGFEELNNMVHYRTDNWGQLDAEELRDVLHRWRDIEDYLTCDECNDFLRYDNPGDWHWIQCDAQHMPIGYEE